MLRVNRVWTRLCAALLAAGAMGGGAALGANFNEVEDNNSKAAATAVTMACGDTLTGTTTGTATTTGAGSIDYWKITTPTTTPGVYKYTLTLTSTTAGHTATIRGLNQTSGGTGNPGVVGTTDTVLQTARTVGTDRVSTFYGYGTGGQIYYAVAGTTTTTAPYVVTLTCEAVPVTDVVGTIIPESLTVRPDTATDTAVDSDFFVLDGSFNAIAGFSHDDADATGLVRPFNPGTYYIGFGPYNTTYNLPAPADDTFQTAVLLDFPGVSANTSTTASASIGVEVAGSQGVAAGTGTRGDQFEITWFRFIVGPAAFPTAVASATPNPVQQGSPVTISLLVTPAQASSLDNITSVTANVSGVSGNGAQTAVPLTRVGTTNQWQLTVPAANGSFGAQTVTYTITDPQSAGGNGTGTLTVTVAAPNDDCAGATPIAVGQTALGSNAGATNESPTPPTCNGLSTFNLGVWFRFTETAGIARRLTVSTCDAQTNFNTRVHVYSGSCAGLACVNANATATPACAARADAAAVTFCTSPGTTYYFLVTNDTTGSGAFGLSLTDTGLGCNPVANDVCSGATQITLVPNGPAAFATDNTGFNATTDNIDIGTCNATSAATNGVWFRFDAPGAGVVNFAETSAQDVATGIWEFTTGAVVCPSAGPATVCNAAESFTFNVQAGRSYLMLVHTDSTVAPTVGIAGTLTYVPPLTNDNCSGATVITAPGVVNINNQGAATNSSFFTLAGCVGGQTVINNDVWFRWTAPASGRFAFMPRNPSPEIAMRSALYDGGVAGTCPADSSAPLTCSSAAHSGALLAADVVGGRTYFIQVGVATLNTIYFGAADVAFVPTATGRCCNGSACSVTSQAQCAASGGTYGGDGSLCSAATATVSTYTGAGGAIPDAVGANPGVRTSQIVIGDSFTVAGVEVQLDINHVWTGDLQITLSNGTRTIDLLNRTLRGALIGAAATVPSQFGTQTSLNTGSAYVFNDAAAQNMYALAQPGTITGGYLAGSYRATSIGGVVQRFSDVFNGQPAAGTWTLTVSDRQAGSVGSLGGWTLRLTRGAANACGTTTIRCCRGSTCTLVTGACTPPGGGSQAGAASAGAGASCNAPGARTPCCLADYNKVNNVDLLDIFAFLEDWFLGVPWTNHNGDQNASSDLLDIFSFLTDWFAGPC